MELATRPPESLLEVSGLQALLKRPTPIQDCLPWGHLVHRQDNLHDNCRQEWSSALTAGRDEQEPECPSA